MHFIRSLAAAFATIALWATSIGADTPVDWNAVMAEADWDWRPGDLIFRNGLNASDELIRSAENAVWASVGILRASSGSPRVIYVDDTNGVTEVMLEEFLDGLGPSNYAVYRVKGDTSEPAHGHEVQGPLVTYSVFVAYGAPYDRLFRFGNGQYYGAELPFEAALSAGVVLGQPQPLREIASPSTALGQFLLRDWDDNPFCVVSSSPEECWEMIGDASIITPSSVINSGMLEFVFPR